MKTKIIAAIVWLNLLIGGAFFANGQTGPGGVGNSATNKIWLDASSLTGLNNNSPISTWIDRSGNNWNAVQVNSNNKPTYLMSGLNSRPVVHFNRSVAPQFLQITNTGVGIAMSNSHTIFAVSKANTAGAGPQDQGLYQLVFTTGAGYISGIYYKAYPTLTDVVSIQWIGGNGESPTRYVSSSSPTSINTWSIAAQVVNETATGTNLKGFANGTLKGTSANSLQIANYAAFDNVTIGAYLPSGYMSALNGDIAEIIFFNTSLNDPQRIIIDNYLSAKYGLSIANDYYSGHDLTYIQDVQGIGTTNGSATNKHSQAESGKGLRLSELNNSLNATNEFLFSGHGSSANSWMNDIVSSVQSRWERTWYLKKTGSVDAKLLFDFSEAGLASDPDLVNTISNYKLLYRATITSPCSIVQSAGVDVFPTLENGDQLAFSLGNAQLNNGYYTLGYAHSLTWSGMINDQWNLPGNWNQNRIPEVNDHIYIDACTTCPELSGHVTIAGLRLNNDSELNLKGNTLTVSGTIYLTDAKITSNEGAIKGVDFVEIKNSVFTGVTILEKTGGTSNACYGGNTFSPELKIVNSSNNSFTLATQVSNVIQ